MTESKKPHGEVAAMGIVEGALQPLDPDERGRILRWAAERFGATLPALGTNRQGAGKEQHHVPSDADEPQDLGELYARASPKTEPERALIVAYWVQGTDAKGEFDSQTVNNHLKNLGHAVSNITRTLDDLKKRKPQLVIQIEKAGKAKQARKRFKLTVAGKAEVKRMLAGKTEE
jgi:hypothetical protein